MKKKILKITLSVVLILILAVGIGLAYLVDGTVYKVYMCCPSLCFLYVYIMIITLYTVYLSYDYIIWLLTAF